MTPGPQPASASPIVASTIVASPVVSSPVLGPPPPPGGTFAKLLAEQWLPALLARVGARVASALGRPVRWGSTVLVARHAHVVEVLTRDLEFRIAPVNAARIEAVNGPFVLGMDRDPTLAREREALYRGLSAVHLAPIKADVAQAALSRIDGAGDKIDVVAAYARPIAARTAQSLFGVKGRDDQTFMEVARVIFAHTFLNLSGDKDVEKRALAAAGLMRAWLDDEIRRRRASGQLGTDMMGAMLAQGVLDDDGVRRTLGGMLVGSVDTTASSVAKIVAMIGRDPGLAASFAADANDEERLAGWCWEALRRWPHNPILLRRAAADTRLAGTDVRAGDQIVAWTQAAMLDASAFPSPAQLRPDRPSSSYLHFGAGLHPCAGRAVNAFQIPILVGALVRRGIKAVGKVQWAGPFPDRLSLRFTR